MSKKFTLDAIREATEAKYGSTVIEFSEDGNDKVELRNPLRLTKVERKELGKLQDALSSDDADQAKGIGDIITLAASNKGDAKAFLAAVGEDLAVLAEVLRAWTEDAQVGEASGSQN